MIMKQLKWIPAALLLCICAACNKDDDNNSDTLSDTDRTFMTNASYSNYAEVSAGSLAASQGNMSTVKSFGTMMVSDHTSAQADLVSIGTQVGKTDLPTGPDSAHQAMTHMLMMMSGRAFDSAYMKMQVIDHQKTIDLMNAEINNGREQRVKNYASAKLPTVQMHKRMADSIVAANGF